MTESMPQPAKFGAGPVEIGAPMETVGLKKFNADEGTSYLINPLVNMTWPYVMCYKEGHGFFHDFDRSALGDNAGLVPPATPYFYLPCLIYSGWQHVERKLTSAHVDFMYLRLNEKTYHNQVEGPLLVQGEDAKLFARDILVTCDNREFQKLTLSDGGTRRWPKFPKAQKEEALKRAKAYMILFKAQIAPTAGRAYSAQAFLLREAELGKSFTSGSVDFDTTAALPAEGQSEALAATDDFDDILGDQPVDTEHTEAVSDEPDPSDDFPFETEETGEAAEPEDGLDVEGDGSADDEFGLGEGPPVPDTSPAKPAKAPKKAPKKAASKPKPRRTVK